jgi:hypothetical protein
MSLVMHPQHAGAAAPCGGTAFDPDTATYVPCPHPAHNPGATPFERLCAENEELRVALARWKNVAAAFQLAQRLPAE